MTIAIEQNLSTLLPKLAVQELVERYGDAYTALFNAEEAEWRNSIGMGQRGLEKLLAIKSIVYDIQHRSQTALTSASNPQEVFRAMSDMQFFETEHVRVLYLNAKNRIIKSEDISMGNVTSASMDIKCVFSSAIRLKASAIILVHNHPSGDPQPSREDVTSTKRLSEAGQLLDIPVLDHIIIGRGQYKSLTEEGLM